MVEFFWRLALAAASGGLVFSSFAPLGWWSAGLIGMALFYASLVPWRKRAGNKRKTSPRPSYRQGAALGFIQALVCYLALLPWIGEFVGNPPYIALSVVLALYTVATGIGGVALGRARFAFVTFALWYLAVEYARSNFPFGGFGWVRLAWGQVDGPLAGLAQWGGPALVTAVTVWIGSALAHLVLVAWQRRGNAGAATQRAVAVSVPVAAGIVVIPLAAGLTATTNLNSEDNTFDEITVAAIQGNVPRLGLDFNAQRRAVLANHVRETEKLAPVADDIDIVFWPENSSDVNPFTDPKAEELIRSAVERVDTPIVVGTITQREGNSHNTMQVFEPDSSGQGMKAGEYHDKIYLQPFGETLPMRSFFEKISEYAEMAGDFSPGDGDGTISIPVDGHTESSVVVGVATCYEVAFDPAFRDAVTAGASILTSPTNNATFGFTDMTYQQLAMSRMRAIETDRAVVVPATSGVSALVDPDGTVLDETKIFEPNHLIDTLPLRSGLTPAVRYGQLTELIMVIGGVVLGICAVIRRRFKE